MMHSNLHSTPWPLHGFLLGLGVLALAPGAGRVTVPEPVLPPAPLVRLLPVQPVPLTLAELTPRPLGFQVKITPRRNHPALRTRRPVRLMPVLDPLPPNGLVVRLTVSEARWRAEPLGAVLTAGDPTPPPVESSAPIAQPQKPVQAVTPQLRLTPVWGPLAPALSFASLLPRASSIPAALQPEALEFSALAVPLPPPEPSPPPDVNLPAPGLAAAAPPAPGATAAAMAAPEAAPASAAMEGMSLAPLPAVALDLAPHHSLLLSSREPLERVAMADDTIAKAIVVSPHQLLVEGKSPGEVSLLVWSGAVEPRTYNVHVALDPTPLQQELAGFYPRQQLRVTSSGNALTLTGTVPSAAMAKQVLNVAASFAPKIVNDLTVDPAPDPEEVLLQVRFAEVDRSAVTQLGANLLSTAPAMVGSIGTGQFGPPANVTAPAPSQSLPGTVSGTAAAFALNDLLNVFLFSRSANLGVLLQTLQQKDLLQILAEPNLVAMDGQQASFLAGGEFPFPVVQGEGVVNNVTIQFKPYGINLHFTPNILPDGTIELKVMPEVSSLDYSNAVTMSGFVIPALTTRRASTELELKDGQSFVIAGLLDNRLTKVFSKIPGLSSIPILGKFFESSNTNKSRTELMVVVTAHLMRAGAPSPTLRMPEPFLHPQKFDGKAGGR
ncbi:MAG: type II and III secretion system protein family protein [Terriglobales bacterium]